MNLRSIVSLAICPGERFPFGYLRRRTPEGAEGMEKPVGSVWTEMKTEEKLHTLLSWMKNFQLASPHNSFTDLTSGEAIAELLNKIDGEFFTNDWLKSICFGTTDPFMKKRNLRITLERLEDGFSVRLKQQGDFPFPQEKDISEKRDVGQLVTLLQLVLWYSVHCEQSREIVTQIQQMDQALQTSIMMSITDIQHRSDVSSDTPDSIPGGIPKPGPNSIDISSNSDEVEKLRLENEDLKLSLVSTKESLLTMRSECDTLRRQLKEVERTVGGMPQTVPQLKIRIQELEDMIEKVESTKEELRQQVTELEKQLKTAKSGNMTLMQEQRRLQDEVDALRESQDKLTHLEKTVQNLSKSAEEVPLLRSRVQDLKEQCEEHLKEKIRLEETKRAMPRLQAELDKYAKELEGKGKQLEEETQKVAKERYDNKVLREKIQVLEMEKKSWLEEKEKWEETNLELGGGRLKADGLYDVPMDIKEKLLRLEHENEQLKAQESMDLKALQQKLHESREREEMLSASNKKAQEKVFELELQINDLPALSGDSAKEMERVYAQLHEKDVTIAALQDSLSRKTAEMDQMEERYKKYIVKAKMVLKAMDPQQGSGSSQSDVSCLREQLLEKQKLIDKLRDERERDKAIHETEQKLMASAFYNMGVQLEKQAMDRRLASLNVFATRREDESALRTIVPRGYPNDHTPASME
ncbi:unnamed protein product [Darwinula stevensoni]|uniref:Protein hook n=1 Tax=Darwinula stevensoni TaxID=69355 RepID=A0A7R8ZZL2_9CRUS|nr:unnamed protein product [Darwinula stevensoni]CAG0882735.1 unnamed protein product [Darwinula stevensoni]